MSGTPLQEAVVRTNQPARLSRQPLLNGFRIAFRQAEIRRRNLYNGLARHPFPDNQRVRVQAWLGSSLPEEVLLQMVRDMEANLASRTSGISTQFGMLSLAANKQSILMWSHYADSHRGICIELQSVEDASTDFVGLAVPVEYAESIPHVNFYKHEKLDMAKASILTKARDWEYECEYRVVKPISGLLQMPSGQISGVILGHRTPDQDKEEVSEWIESLDYRVAKYQATINEHTYSLDIVPI